MPSTGCSAGVTTGVYFIRERVPDVRGMDALPRTWVAVQSGIETKMVGVSVLMSWMEGKGFVRQ